MKAAVVSEKGARAEMEDAYFLDLDFGGCGWVFGGVYDGHNGKYAAEYAARRLHQLFLEGLLAGLTPQQAFEKSYEETSEELKDQESGTTAVNFFIRSGKIYTANAGDARAILIGKRAYRQLTVDHRVDHPTECDRVQRMGAEVSYPYVVRGSQGIMPTRTLGDQYFKSVGVIATPSVGEFEISSGDFVLLAACDGLFDFMSNGEVADFVRRRPEADKLVDTFQKEVLVNRQGTDNLTIIALSLR